MDQDTTAPAVPAAPPTDTLLEVQDGEAGATAVIPTEVAHG